MSDQSNNQSIENSNDDGQKSGGDNNDCKVYVGGLSWNLRAGDVEEAFGSYGKILECRLVIDKMTGKSKGFGFVTFDSREAADEAIRGMNGKELDGRAIKCDFASDKPEPRGGDRGSPYSRGGGSGGYRGSRGRGGYGFNRDRDDRPRGFDRDNNRDDRGRFGGSDRRYGNSRGYDNRGGDRGFDRGDRGFGDRGGDRGFDNRGGDRGFDRGFDNRGGDRGFDNRGGDRGFDNRGGDRGFGDRPRREGFRDRDNEGGNQ